MPSNVIDTPADEKKWKKAEDIAEKAGKGGNYAYVMGVYKGMNPDHKFKSARKVAVRSAVSDREIQQYFDWVADLHGPDIISSFGELTGDDLVQFGLDKPLRGHEDQHEKVVAMWKANKNKVRRLADRAAKGRFASASRVASLHTKKAAWVPGEVTDDNENWQPGHYQESEQSGQGSMTPPLRGDEEKQVAEYLEQGRLAPIEEPEYDHDIEDEDEDADPVGKTAAGMGVLRQMVRIKAQVKAGKKSDLPDTPWASFAISGRMWLDMGDAEIAPFRYRATVDMHDNGFVTVQDFMPVSGAIAGGAKSLTAFYEAALQEIISKDRGLLDL